MAGGYGMKVVAVILTGIIDLISLSITPVVAFVSFLQARLGPERLRFTFRVWDLFGLMPVRYHYYQPVFNVNLLPGDTWTRQDPLTGIDLNVEFQLNFLRSFDYNEELEVVPVNKPDAPLGFYHNKSFPPADAEMLYNIVRHFKPGRVIEIGSGYSTRMMKRALDRNREEGIEASHICIEPFEMPWLEEFGVEVVRNKVEDVDPKIFEELEANDVLYIDSSHVLRTGGDVFTEYLRIIPSLKPGVLIHIHDIFLPFEYPRDWIVDKRWFWTEQYLLQAFLSFNREFEVISAVHYLALHHREELEKCCPVFRKLGQGHGSFWMKRRG